MNAPWIRYWHGLSPALRRYYRASVWPSLVFLALAALHECALIQDETRVEALATPARDIILDAGWL